jgi:hypothetical protein
LGVFAASNVLNWQSLLPVCPIAIFNSKRDWRTDSLSVPHAGKSFSAIVLNFLAPAASVAKLPAVQFAPDEFHVHGYASGHAGYPGDQRLSVGLSGSDESKHDVSKSTLLSEIAGHGTAVCGTKRDVAFYRSRTAR